jgi:hypothetical protein
MQNGRCRLHRGHSTGPRTQDGIARIRTARTTHGFWTQEFRATRETMAALHVQARLWIAIASGRRHRPLIAIRRIERPLASLPYRRGASFFRSRVGSTFSCPVRVPPNRSAPFSSGAPGFLCVPVFC